MELCIKLNFVCHIGLIVTIVTVLLSQVSGNELVSQNKLRRLRSNRENKENHQALTHKYAKTQVVKWDNVLDRPLSVECSHENGEALFRVRSQYSGWARDRRWKWDCHKIVDKAMTDCSWTPHINTWGGPINKKCEENSVLTGIKSEHWNAREDRRWRLQCCKAPGYVTTDCKKTGNANKMYGWLDYKTPKKGALVGLHSIYHSGRDRVWQFFKCKYKAKKQPEAPSTAPPQNVMTRHFYYVPYDMLSNFVSYMPWGWSESNK